MAPVLYEVVEWNEIKPYGGNKETTAKVSKAKKKSVSSQKIADLFDLSNEPINNTNNETV